MSRPMSAFPRATLLFMFLVAAACGRERPGGLATDTARKTWLPSEELDLGMKLVGTTFVGRFLLRNPDSQARRILGVRRSCTCQGLRFLKSGKDLIVSGSLNPPLLLQPGEEDVLEFRLESKFGAQSMQLTILTDAPNAPTVIAKAVYRGVPFYVLSGDADVQGGVSLDPLPEGAHEEFRVRVARHDHRPFTIQGTPDGLPDRMRLSFEPGDERRSWTIRGRVGPADDSVGSLGGSLLIATDSQQMIRLSIRAPVIRTIERSPDSLLSFGVVQKGKAKEGKWSLRLTRLGSLKPKTIRIEAQVGVQHRIQIEETLSPEKGRLDLRVLLQPGNKLGRLEGSLIVEFEDPKLVPQRIRYLGYVM